eukprot:4193977-Pleurochrysis_carterae.AAC.1
MFAFMLTSTPWLSSRKDCVMDLVQVPFGGRSFCKAHATYLTQGPCDGLRVWPFGSSSHCLQACVHSNKAFMAELAQRPSDKHSVSPM